jgi:pimeloyl-ACP methyl ester carboxylesterase
MSLKGQNIRVNGVNLNVVIEGKGPVVILLHGFPDSAYLWRNQILPLSGEGYRVIAPDLRGFGDSDAPEGKGHYLVDTIVRDVTALVDRLGVGRAIVTGHDWGSVIGWTLSVRHPELVDRYIALSVGHPQAYKKADPMQMLRAWYTAVFQIPGLAEKTMPANDWFIMRRITRNHPETRHWIEDLSRPGRITAGLNWYRANMARMLLTNLPPAKVPVLGIWSAGDIFLTEAQMRGSAKYVDAPWRYERIEDSSHWIPLDAPGRLNRILLEYFKQPVR